MVKTFDEQYEEADDRMRNIMARVSEDISILRGKFLLGAMTEKQLQALEVSATVVDSVHEVLGRSIEGAK